MAPFKHITLCLMFFALFFVVVVVVYRIEDIFDVIPRENLPLLPSSMIKGFNGSIGDFNMINVQEIQHKLSRYINQWQAVQVILPDVRSEKIALANDKRKLRILEQSTVVSKHFNCALVGNAGILLNSSCGAVIDDFDFVIRMNLAPSGGEFRHDVGSKVNLMSTNLEQMERLISCTNSSYPPEWKCNSTDVICLKRRSRKYPDPRPPSECDDLLRRLRRINGTTLWFSKKIRSVYHSAMKQMLGALKRKYNLSIDFAYSPVNPMKAAARAWNVGFPSSGLAIYSAATQFCQQITMFGFYPFSKDSKNRTLRHHYYEEGKMNYASNKHHMPNEYRVLTSLNQTGAIHLVNECR